MMRHRRGCSGLLALSLTLALAPLAQAQAQAQSFSYRPGGRRVGQSQSQSQSQSQKPAQGLALYPRWGFELRAGPYRPRLNADPRIRGLYNALYGGKHSDSLFEGRPMLYAAQLNWYPSSRWGLLGGFVRVGFWRVANKGLLCNPPNDCSIDTYLPDQQGTDTATMSAVPASIGGIYRWDGLRRRFDLPIVASLKAGVDYWLWWGDQGAGTARYHAPGSPPDDPGSSAIGRTLGLSASAQLAVGLDVFNRKRMPYGTAISGQLPYLFIEYQQIYGKDVFGQGNDRLDMTPQGNWAALVGFAVDSR